MTARLHIIGRKNSGKTTLVAELIAHLTRRGLRVGSIKHTHHHHELDVPGKDSFRHRESGASPVAILSPGMTAIFRPNSSGIAADGYAWLEGAFGECDLVLVEGDSETRAAKIEVWRAAAGSPPMAAEIPDVRAVVTDDLPRVSQPLWPRANVTELAERILELARSR
jgi:molybdopterin-guanine dinucleotide biosynthesis protein B